MNYYKSLLRVLSILFLIIFSSCNIEPFEGEILEQEAKPSSCIEAVQNTATAASSFTEALSTDSNYTELCSAYKKALQDQISVCGDQAGAFQSLVDSLGDCDKEEEINNEDGDYWPMSIGNTWTYTSEITGMSNSESTMEIKDLVDYQGVSSYFYENFFSTIQGTDGTAFQNLEVDYYTRKSAGEYTLLVGELTADLSGLYKITQGGYDYVILKDNVDVGTKWNYKFDVVTSYKSLQPGGADLPDATANYDIELEILEKNATVVSGGATYNSVIKVKFSQNVVVLGLTSKAEYVYSFAKDVGIVKIEGTIFDVDDNITSNVLQQLTSYNIN